MLKSAFNSMLYEYYFAFKTVTAKGASFGSTTDEVGIQKMRSLFFERTKSSPGFFGIAGIPIKIGTGCGGESNQFKRANKDQNAIGTK